MLTGEARVAFDLGALTAAFNAAFEAQHPRGHDGRFITKGGWVKFALNGLWQLAKVVDIDGPNSIKVEYHDNADDKDVEVVKTPKELFHAEEPVKVKARLDPKQWKNVGGQAGSNVGGFYEDDNGEKWYVKTPRSPSHAANEHLMNVLYGEAGVATKPVALSPDGKNFLTKVVDSEGWGSLTGQALEDAKEEAGKDFVVDAWLANWDAPVNSDNIRITPEGKALRVDAGGAGLYRARGAERKLVPNVGELVTMRDPSMSRAGASLYSKVTRDQEVDAAKRILAITPARIRELTKADNLPSKLAEALIARRAWLANHYGLALPETTPEGIAMLYKKPKTAEVKAVISKLSSPDAVNIVPGAPIFIKGKNVGTVVPDGARTPQIMMVKKLHDDGTLDLETFSGKVELLGVAPANYEALRDNRSRVAVSYTGGESPQIGDEIETKNGVKGTVTGFWVNSALGKDENGKSFSIAIKDAKLLVAGEGSVGDTTPAVAAKTKAALGEPMDVSNPLDRFPLMAFSKRHNAEVFVIDHDPTTGKAKIAITDAMKNTKVATVNDDTLFPPDTVDRAAAAALFNAKMNAPKKVAAAKTLEPLDQMGEKYVNFPPASGISPIEIHPGDRVIKMKEKGNSQINYFVIRKNGDFKFIGKNNNRGNFTWNDELPITSLYNFLNANSWRRGMGAEYTDMTPGRYNEAANELGPKQINIPKEPVKFTWTGFDAEGYSAAYDAYKQGNGPYPNYYDDKYKKTFQTTLHPEINDEIIPFVVKGSKSLGNSSIHDKDSAPTVVPRIFLKRDGKVYDIGRGGEYYEKPDRWVAHPAADWDTIKNLATPQQWSSNDPGKGVLSDGTEVRAPRYDERSTTNSFKIVADKRTALEGKASPDIALSSTRTAFSGVGQTFGEHLARIVDNWKLDPNAAARAAGLPSGPAEDVSNLSGVKALKHRLTTSRESMINGDNDTRLAEIMFSPVKAVDGGGVSRSSSLYEISDGSVHGDPYMAQFAADLDGDQPTLVAPTKLFNLFKKMSGSSILHRGVASADQAAALKEGNHFNGTGVYGNGIYTSPHASTASAYGGNKVDMIIKPGARWLDNTDVFLGQAEDIAESVKQRQDVLATAGFPTVDEILSFDVARDQSATTALAGHSVDAGQMHVKAALLTLNRLRAAGVSARFDVTNDGYSNGNNVMKITVVDGNGPDITVLTFKKPWAADRTTYGRRTQVDDLKNFSFSADIIDASTKTTKLGSRIGQRYNSGWFLDHTSEALLQSGVLGKMVAHRNTQQSSSVSAGEVAEDAKKVDARISFMTDPGRWALGAGYDYYYIPGEGHHIFTHRAAFILRES